MLCTSCVPPGDQAVKVGETIGGGVEEHQRVKGGRLLTQRQKQSFSGVEKNNLIDIDIKIIRISKYYHLAD